MGMALMLHTFTVQAIQPLTLATMHNKLVMAVLLLLLPLAVQLQLQSLFN